MTDQTHKPQTSMTVAEIAAHFSRDKARTKKAVEKEIYDSALVTFLIKIRHDRGMTQTEIAKRMSCSVSKVSRIESGTDSRLSFQDILDYSHAVDVHPAMMFEPRDTQSPMLIRQFVFGIEERLEHLAVIARESREGDVFSEKIHLFFGEVLFNIIKKFGDIDVATPRRGSGKNIAISGTAVPARKSARKSRIAEAK